MNLQLDFSFSLFFHSCSHLSIHVHVFLSPSNKNESLVVEENGVAWTLQGSTVNLRLCELKSNFKKQKNMPCSYHRV
jgi:hypothetical protein